MNLKRISTTLLIVLGLVFSLSGVNAQSQTDVTVCEFDAASTENLYIQLNYSCENTTWLPRTYEIYRKVDSGQITTCDESGQGYTNFQLDGDTARFPSLRSNGDSLNRSNTEYFVEDYMLFYQLGDADGEGNLHPPAYDLRKRDTITWFESEYGKANHGELNLAARRLPRPFLVTETLAGSVPALAEFEGYVVCPDYRIEGGGADAQYSSTPTSFQRADLVPPTIQEFENLFIDAIYLIWGFAFVFGIAMLIWLGFQFIYGGTSPERLGELRSKLILWFVGLIFIILAVPIIQFIYSLAGISSTKCYEYEENGEIVYDLSLPGFTFFFNDVCTGSFAISDS